MEILTGDGTLLRDGKPVGECQYRLEISTRPSGLGHIDGQITMDADELRLLIIENAPVTLRLNDGKCWDCWVQSESGRLVGRGGSGLH